MLKIRCRIVVELVTLEVELSASFIIKFWLPCNIEVSTHVDDSIKTTKVKIVNTRAVATQVVL